MIMCAVHHTNIDLCGCDADEQYRAAQSGTEGERSREELEARDAVFQDDAGLWVRDPLGNCRPFDIHDYESLQNEAASLKEERDEAIRSLETAVLDAAVSGRLDDAGSPLTWQEVAQAAEQALSEVRGEVVRVLEPFMPIAVRETPDYAEVTFGEHQTQAMTMQPDDWIALSTLHDKLSSDVFPESPSGDVSTHAAGEGSANPSARGEL